MNHQKLIPLLLMISILFSTSSCVIARIGKDISESDLARKPGGTTVDITFKDNSELSGELLALNTNSVIVLVKNHDLLFLESLNDELQIPAVAEVSFLTTRDIVTSHYGKKIVNDGKPFRDRNGEISLLCRYPQGISSELMDNLLEAYNQEHIVKLYDD